MLASGALENTGFSFGATGRDTSSGLIEVRTAEKIATAWTRQLAMVLTEEGGAIWTDLNRLHGLLPLHVRVPFDCSMGQEMVILFHGCLREPLYFKLQLNDCQVRKKIARVGGWELCRVPRRPASRGHREVTRTANAPRHLAHACMIAGSSVLREGLLITGR